MHLMTVAVTLQVTVPQQNTVWYAGQYPYNVTFVASAGIDTVRVELLNAQSQVVTTYNTSFPTVFGPNSLIVLSPANVTGTEFKIRVVCLPAGVTVAQSVNFEIRGFISRPVQCSPCRHSRFFAPQTRKAHFLSTLWQATHPRAL